VLARAHGVGLVVVRFVSHVRSVVEKEDVRDGRVQQGGGQDAAVGKDVSDYVGVLAAAAQDEHVFWACRVVRGDLAHTADATCLD